MNTTIIIIMIICATLIALVTIICDHLFEKKSIGSCDCYMSKKLIKVHRNYIAGFLGFAIIMLITAQYGGPNNALFTYISFGSTITSMVLSILAIFVTVQSNSDFNKQFGTINKVSSQIDGTLKDLKDAESKLESTSSMISSQMNNIVDNIYSRIADRFQKTEDTLSKQIQKQNTIISNITNKTIDPGDANTFLKNIPYSGMLLLYACAKGKENKKPFKMSQLFKDNEKYQLGVLVTAIAAGFLNASITTMAEDYHITCKEVKFESKDVYKLIEDQAPDYDADAVESTKIINEFFDK